MSPHLTLLKEIYPGKLILSLSEVAEVFRKNSTQSIYNQIHQGKFPCHVIRHKDTNGKKGNVIGVSIIEIARFLDGTVSSALKVNLEIPVKRKRGRPRKPHPQLRTSECC